MLETTEPGASTVASMTSRPNHNERCCQRASSWQLTACILADRGTIHPDDLIEGLNTPDDPLKEQTA